jgi:hypothetical protein
MDIKETRVSRLKQLVRDNGGAAAVSRKHPEIDASYISQLINGHRPFGEKSARNLESILGLAQNYFDTSEQNYTKSDRLSALHKIAQELPDYAIDEVIRDAIKTAELIAHAKADKNGTEK